MIDKVGGIILNDKKILVQRKRNNRIECIIPGGKRENNETDFETLKKEISSYLKKTDCKLYTELLIKKI